ATGQVPIVASNILDLDRVVPPDLQASLPVIRLHDYTVPALREAHGPSGHPETLDECPLLRVKGTFPRLTSMSVIDPRRHRQADGRRGSTDLTFCLLTLVFGLSKTRINLHLRPMSKNCGLHPIHFRI